VIRDLVDQIRTRRAFEIGRGMLLEQPSYFLLSIVEMRDATRKLLERLPVKATQSRLILLTVMDWLAEILDEWHRAQKNVNPRAWNFQQLDMSDMRRVMKDCWSVVEKARVHLSQLRSDLESQLKL
jgi:hypothetical protein